MTTNTTAFATDVARRLADAPDPPQIDPAIIALILQIVTMILEKCQQRRNIVKLTREAIANDVSQNRAILGVTVRATMDDMGFPRRFGDVARVRAAILDAAAAKTDEDLQVIADENAYMGV